MLQLCERLAENPLRDQTVCTRANELKEYTRRDSRTIRTIPERYTVRWHKFPEAVVAQVESEKSLSR